MDDVTYLSGMQRVEPSIYGTFGSPISMDMELKNRKVLFHKSTVGVIKSHTPDYHKDPFLKSILNRVAYNAGIGVEHASSPAHIDII